MVFFSQLEEVNRWEYERFNIPAVFRTSHSLKQQGWLKRAGQQRLERFGDLALIDQFCQLYPAYKHDEVFELEYIFVIERLEYDMIKSNINNLLNEYANEDAKQRG